MLYSLIPAKVKSSRLPGKNTFKFMLGNKPLIAYTIDAVAKAKICPRVFSNEFNDYDVLPPTVPLETHIVFRPENICTSKTTMKETVKEFIKIMEIKPTDAILLTYLTCPFRTGDHILKAMDLMTKTNAKSLQSVTAVNYRPYGLMNKFGSNTYLCLQDQEDYYQKQNTPTLYKANGAIYIFKVSELDKLNNQMFNLETIGFELDPIEGLDIDTKLDLMLAEKILERKSELYSINEHFVNQLPDKRGCETEHHSNGTWSDSSNIEAIWT